MNERRDRRGIGAAMHARLPVFVAALLTASLAQAASDDVLLDEITIRVLDDVEVSGQVFDIVLPEPDDKPAPGKAKGLAGPGNLPNENASENALNGAGNASDRGRSAAANANERASQAGDNANERASQAGNNANEAAGNAAGNAADAAADARENNSNASENARNNPSRNAPGRNRDKNNN